MTAPVTEIDLEPGPERGMSYDEEMLADSAYAAVMSASRHSARGEQAAEFKVGISDLGYCSERTRRMLRQEVPQDTDLLPAFIGTALGTGIEYALELAWPDAVLQAEVIVPLIGDQATYYVTGHPDLIRPVGLVVDVKTSRGLALPRRIGPSQQQQFQRHCYAKGAWLGGLFPGVPLEQVQVANIWFDRAADERECYVQMEPYDEDVVIAATQWLDEVVYAYVNQSEARKEPAREVCERTCGFFSSCRMLDTDAEGLLTDETVLAGVDLYREGLDLERRGRFLKDQGKAALHAITGSTGEYAVRWVHVGGSHVEFDRKPHERLDIKRIK